MNDFDDDFDTGPRGDGLSGLIANVPKILWQRRWFVIVPLIAGMIAAVAAWLVVPTMYQSKAVLLVESSQLQTDGNGQVAPEVIDQRIAKVRQQVLSRPDLIAIIQELQLYPKQRSSTSLTEIVDNMRDDITIEPVSAQIQQSSGARSQTIAFSMSFDYPDAITAQAVAQKLVERILEVDAKRTADQASDSVRFLTEQTEAIRGRMDTIEGELTGIKGRFGQVLGSTGMSFSNSGSLDAQIAMLERENSQLRAQRAAAETGAPRDPVVQQAEATLAALRATYSENHPDVVQAKQRLVEAKELAKRNIANLPFDTVASQIETNNGQLGVLRAARAREAAQQSAAIGAQSQAPLIQQQAAQLQQQLDGLNDQYQESAKQLAEAQTAQRVESEQRGERLTVIDPPVVDDEPVWPNRLILFGGGIGGGLALGLLLAFAIELILQPLRGPSAAASAAGGGDLLGALPTFRDNQKPKRRWWPPALPWQRRRELAPAE